MHKLSGELDEKDIAARLAKLEALKVHPRDEQENVAVKARLERCYVMALGEDRAEISYLLAEFESALTKQDQSFIAIVRARVTTILDDFEANYVRF
ncbi:hypothetical protein [Ruegeria arenilitoris]|uniref:hypothetical protein n=1 Tax=Ruegeria arenilitoris TaxID=1173585 RepID=UPI00147AF8B7|nr:hypothetical protein [Ruegeria arenilitoris]